MTTQMPSEVNVITRYFDVPVLTKWTFDCKTIREWVESNLAGRVLNACCGENELRHSDETVRNDINPERGADFHVDVVELSKHFEPESFETIVFDPPWSIYQSRLRYNGNHVYNDNHDFDVDIDLDSLPFSAPRDKEQLGHGRLAKKGFDYLLKPGGKVIQLSLTGTCMPGRYQYDRVERVMFNQIGMAKVTIGSIDQKTQTRLL